MSVLSFEISGTTMCECHDEAPHEFEWDCACANCMSTMIEQISALELQLRDDEQAAKDKLVEIEHARVELQRRVRCA